MASSALTYKLMGVDVSASKAMQGVGKQAEVTGGKLSKVGTAGKVALVGLGAGLAIATPLIKNSVAAASDLNESTSKMGVIFGDAKADIVAFGKDSAGALGMSKQAAYDAASTFGVMGKAAGLTGRDLAAFSTKMVGLSSDLASFYNSSPEEAIDAIGAAMRGESEPIRRFGVLLDDTTLRARAMKMGLIATTKEALTPQNKALAAQAEILAQTTDAQGDFARTGDGLANSQRTLSGAVQDLEASMGETLLPTMTKVVGGLADIAQAAESIPKPVRDTVVSVGGLALAVGALVPLAKKVPGLTTQLSLLAQGYKDAQVAQSAFSGRAGSVGGGLRTLTTTAAGAAGPIAGVVAGIVALVGVSEAFERQHLADKMGELAKRLDEAQISGQHIADASWPGGFEAMAKAVDRGAYSLSQLKPQFDAVDAQLQKMSPAVAAEEFDLLVKAWQAGGGSVEDLKAQLPGYSGKLREAARSAAESGQSEEDRAAALDAANKAQQGAIDALFAYVRAHLTLSGATDETAGAEDRLREALAESRKEYGRGATSLDRHTKAGRENRKTLNSEIDTVLAHAQAVIDNAKANGETTEKAYSKGRSAILKGRDALIKAAAAAGYSKGEVAKYIDRLLKIPPKTETQIRADKTDAEAKIAKIKARLKERDLTDPEKTKLRADLTKLEAAVEEAKRKLGEVKDKTVKIKLTATVEHGRVYYKDGSGRKKPLDVLFPGGGMGGTGAGLMALTAGKGAPGARWNARGPMWSWHRGPDGQGHHNGVDIVAPGGTPVFATRGGTIVHRGFGGSEGSWAGNNVVERLSNGVKLVFAHLSKSIASGSVSAGGRIGSVGSTGNSSGNHLHVSAIKGGTYVNPVPYLATGGILKARPGGVPFVGAEAGYDEAVIPLPPNWRRGGALAQPQPPIVVQLQADGRTIQEIVVRHEQRTGRYVLSNQRSA